MNRWAPDARTRLQHAAIDLFRQHGFAETTVPQIAERAGLTTRTFFRYFTDKREVLFAGDEIPDFASRVAADAPPGLDPGAFIAHGLQIVAETRFDGRREAHQALRDIIQSDPGLVERDLQKRAALASAVRLALEARGGDPLTAALTAETAVTALYIGLDMWLTEPAERPLSAVLSDVLTTYRALL